MKNIFLIAILGVVLTACSEGISQTQPEQPRSPAASVSNEEALSSPGVSSFQNGAQAQGQQ